MPKLGPIITVRKLNPCKLVILNVSSVVDDHQNLRFISIMLRRISCRTLNLKWTCVLEPIALLQNTINLNSSFLLQKLIYFTLVYWVSLRQSWAQSLCIVVSYKLLSCARNSIMMDTDTQLLELIVFSGKYLLNFLLIDVFSDDLLRKHFALCFH